MDCKRLGKTGLMVSPLTLGCMSFGRARARDAPADPDGRGEPTDHPACARRRDQFLRYGEHVFGRRQRGNPGRVLDACLAIRESPVHGRPAWLHALGVDATPSEPDVPRRRARDAAAVRRSGHRGRGRNPRARGRLARDWTDASPRPDSGDTVRWLYAATADAGRGVAEAVKRVAAGRAGAGLEPGGNRRTRSALPAARGGRAPLNRAAAQVSAASASSLSSTIGRPGM